MEILVHAVASSRIEERKGCAVIADLPTLGTQAARDKISILIVDDSVVVRRLLMDALAEEFEICGYAPSAEMALDKIAQLEPDMLILDIHMPGMSGVELLPILRQRHPLLRVVLFSRSSPESISGCVAALVDGATDFLMKPTEGASRKDFVDALRGQLRMKIALLFPGRAEALATEPFPRSSLVPTYVAMGAKRQREVLAIGVSTGGPTALTAVLQQLPRDYHLPIVIVQHMPPVFTTLLATRIRSVTGLDIVEAADGMVIEAGKGYLAPGNFHMRLVRDAAHVRIATDQGPLECSCRPAVDVLFRSVAEVYGGAAIATVLTGMGQDGLRGVERLHCAGAHVIVQDEASSVVWGMPGAIARARLAHEVLDINSIADAIQRQSGRRPNA